jgi:hypothetical protein
VILSQTLFRLVGSPGFFNQQIKMQIAFEEEQKNAFWYSAAIEMYKQSVLFECSNNKSY